MDILPASGLLATTHMLHNLQPGCTHHRRRFHRAATHHQGSRQTLQHCVQELFPALGSDWQQVSKKKSREPFDPNAPSAGGAWARTASTPTKPPPPPAAEPTAAATRSPDQQSPQERPNRSVVDVFTT